MYEIDKAQFGRFVAELRREKNYTQKQLAEPLCVSDKAVSKWERGLSLPDVGILLPLADVLDVSVTELLESRRMDTAASADMEQVEEIVKKAISFSGEKPAQRGSAPRRVKLVFIFSCCISLAIITYLLFTGGTESFLSGTMTMVGLCFFFGAYFTFFVKERLPGYYDENHVSTYSDGIFRLNLAGLPLNNRNWPHILKTVRLWCSWAQTAIVVFLLVVQTWFPGAELDSYLPAILSALTLGLFVPVYITARKYR